MFPLTRAERTHYLETSNYQDVVSFLAQLANTHTASAQVPIAIGSIGQTTEGRDIPYAIASRPLVTTPEQARGLGRPIVYVNANIHAGEVEGKEALLALLRDLVTAPAPSVLDSVVLIAVPVYNADGNERLAPQTVNRYEQNGPELVGTRANAQGLDLNRDYVKAEAPETRASLAMFAAWDPDVYVDLHTTDGSYHGFALTYAPALSPAAYSYGRVGHFTRDTLLPELRERMHARGMETFDYGNFDADDDTGRLTDTVKHGWYTYNSEPRFGTNYYGLRGGISILSEAYSHDPFERRVAVTYAFVREILSASARHATRLVQRRDAPKGGWPRRVPVRARITTHPFDVSIPFEVLVATGDSGLTQPGIPRGLRRTGRFITQRMPVYDQFEPVDETTVPAAYLIPPGYDKTVAILRQHGFTLVPLTHDSTVSGFEFAIDSLHSATTPFQGHVLRRVAGRWRPVITIVKSGSQRVVVTGRFGALAAYLLDPESDDGLLTWNFFDRMLRVGGVAPVLRLTP